MTQEKMRNLITAIAVAATTLLVLLLAVLVYQWITIGVLSGRENRLEEENAYYQQIIDEGKMDAEFYESSVGKEWLAILNGWSHPEGK